MKEENNTKANVQLCEDCMTEIPSDAEICPTCGCPINVTNTNTHQDTLKLFKQFTCKWWFWGIIVLIFLLIAALSGDSNSTERAKENTIQSSDANSSQEIHSNKSAVDFYKWLVKMIPVWTILFQIKRLLLLKIILNFSLVMIIILVP